MKKIYFIYETTNLINGKRYRGFHYGTVDDSYLGTSLLLHRAIKKYGRRNFKREILEICDSFHHALQRESYFVDEKWVDRDDTYNLKTGGLGGCRHSKNSIELMRRSHQGYITSEETKEKLRKISSGKKQDKEHVRKRTAHLIRGVRQYDINGKLIAEFLSMAEATVVTKINKGNIMSCCQMNRRHAGGFVWKYIDSDEN